MIEHESLVMPSSPEDRKKLNASINEVVNSLTRIKAEQEQKKDAIEAISEEYDIPKKLIAKAASVIYKETLQKVAAENEDLVTFIETIQMSNNPQLQVVTPIQ